VLRDGEVVQNTANYALALQALHSEPSEVLTVTEVVEE